MLILHSLLKELKEEFVNSRKGEERGTWFVYTLLAIIFLFVLIKDIKSSTSTLNCVRIIDQEKIA